MFDLYDSGDLLMLIAMCVVVVGAAIGIAIYFEESLMKRWEGSPLKFFPVGKINPYSNRGICTVIEVLQEREDTVSRIPETRVISTTLVVEFFSGNQYRIFLSYGAQMNSELVAGAKIEIEFMGGCNEIRGYSPDFGLMATSYRICRT